MTWKIFLFGDRSLIPPRSILSTLRNFSTSSWQDFMDWPGFGMDDRAPKPDRFRGLWSRSVDD